MKLSILSRSLSGYAKLDQTLKMIIQLHETLWEFISDNQIKFQSSGNTGLSTSLETATMISNCNRSFTINNQ